MNKEQSTLKVEVDDAKSEEETEVKSAEERVIDRAVENYEPHPLAP